MKENHCFKEFRWYLFIIGGIGFCVWETLIAMHPSLALKRKRLRRYFLTRHCLPKRHRLTKCKANFFNLKKTQKNTETKFWLIRTQLSEPLSADKNQWFQNVYWLLLTNIFHFCSPRKLTSIEFSHISCCVGSLG